MYHQQILDFVSSFKDEQITKSNLISYALLTEDINLYSIIEHFEREQKDYFYYSKPEQNFFLLTLGEVLSFSFDNIEQLNKFSTEFSRIRHGIYNNFTDINYNPPLFFLSAKFPSNKLSMEWKTFSPVKLFIPELILVKANAKTYLIINTQPESNLNKSDLSERIINKLNYFTQINNFFYPGKLKPEIKLVSANNFSEWKSKVETVLSGIINLEYNKVVLSRRTDFKISEQIAASDLASVLDQKYPECFNFIYKVNGSLFFSASPEKLIIIENGQIHTEALAGSIERGYDDSEDKYLEIALTNSPKDIDEHVFVIDHLKSVLINYCSEVKIDKSPSFKKLTNIQHLHTGLSGKIKNGFEPFQLIKDIFPTPAVGGYPVRPTIKVIDQIEDFDRGLFTGFVGWMNLINEGEFIVSIRSGLINQNNLFVYAGCGIVAGSDPKKEFEETQLKSEAIISLFNYENKD